MTLPVRSLTHALDLYRRRTTMHPHYDPRPRIIEPTTPASETPPSLADAHLADLQAANRQLASDINDTVQRSMDLRDDLARTRTAIRVALEDLHEGNTAEAIALLRRHA